MIKSQEITMDSYAIAHAIKTWCHYPGFTAEWCHNQECQASINTFAHSPGWFCPRCDDFNNQPFSCSFMPHIRPEFGPTAATIRKGGRIADRYSRKAHRFTLGQKVWANKCTYPDRRIMVEAGVIVKGADDCWPFLTSYWIRFDEETFNRMIWQADICRRNLRSTIMRAVLFAGKKWLTDINQVAADEIERAVKAIHGN